MNGVADESGTQHWSPRHGHRLRHHDTITSHPEFFALISKALVQAGHRVLIVTFRDEVGRADTEADLAGWGIAYDELICWSMACCDLGEVDVWKAKVCREHGVEVFFEDDANVLVHVDEGTVCMQPFNADTDGDWATSLSG